MAVTHSQTAEDGPSNRAPEITLHHPGEPVEFLQVAIVIRKPWALTDFRKRLVIRASQHTGRVTAALIEDA